MPTEPQDGTPSPAGRANPKETPGDEAGMVEAKDATRGCNPEQGEDEQKDCW